MYKQIYVNNEQFKAFRVLFCGVQDCDPGYSYGPAIRDHYVLHFCTEGKGEFHYNNKVYTINAGDAFIIYPNTVEAHKADNVQPWTYFWVSFKGDMSSSYLDAVGITKENPVAHYDKIEEMILYVEDILMHAKADAKDQMKIQAYLLLILAQFAKENEINERGMSQTNTYIASAVSFIEDNYQNDISITDIANHVYLNRSYLYTLFQNELGVSPHEYLKRYRINKACNMLELTRYSIKEIAYTSGYLNIQTFSRSFSKVMGQSPSSYRDKFGLSKGKHIAEH